MFKGLLIDKQNDRQSAALQLLSPEDLPEGNVTVRVAYSSLNYKDALAITGRSPVVRRFPMVPGIDLAGTVEASSSSDYKVGDAVVLNGWGVGETHWGAVCSASFNPMNRRPHGLLLVRPCLIVRVDKQVVGRLIGHSGRSGPPHRSWSFSSCNAAGHSRSAQVPLHALRRFYSVASLALAGISSDCLRLLRILILSASTAREKVMAK